MSLATLGVQLNNFNFALYVMPPVVCWE